MHLYPQCFSSGCADWQSTYLPLEVASVIRRMDLCVCFRRTLRHASCSCALHNLPTKTVRRKAAEQCRAVLHISGPLGLTVRVSKFAHGFFRFVTDETSPAICMSSLKILSRSFLGATLNYSSRQWPCGAPDDAATSVLYPAASRLLASGRYIAQFCWFQDGKRLIYFVLISSCE